MTDHRHLAGDIIVGIVFFLISPIIVNIWLEYGVRLNDLIDYLRNSYLFRRSDARRKL